MSPLAAPILRLCASKTHPTHPGDVHQKSLRVSRLAMPAVRQRIHPRGPGVKLSESGVMMEKTLWTQCGVCAVLKALRGLKTIRVRKHSGPPWP